jgi:CubicO group peptidase (beta-lactamase class C family)
MTNATLDNLDRLIEEVMKEWQVPGLAIAVVQEDEPVLLKAYGYRDVEASLPVTTDTQFMLCSITKSFTAAGLGMLVDDRRLDWMKPVREYVPEFRLRDPVATDRVTVRDLLGHHSGLPRHDWMWMPGDLSQEQMLAALRHLDLSRDIRSRYQYSNLGYMVAGTVAERITGLSWEDFTRERLMRPLEMKHFGFSAEDLEQSGDSARPYIIADDLRRRASVWPARDTPAGGINASISSMVNYVRFHLAGGRFNGKQLLSSAIIRYMQTPRVHAGRSEFDEIGDYHYGLGLQCGHYRGERSVGHEGGWIGWGTLMAMLPDRGVGVVILTNRDTSPVEEILAYAIFDRVCGKDPIPWLDRFRTRTRQFVAQRKIDRQARVGTRKPETQPSHALPEYAGEYEHPAYGRITIEITDDTLRWRYRGLSGPLVHRHYDVFEVPENPAAELSPNRLTIMFLYDREGNIDRLSAPFEPLVPAIVFQRVAGGDVLDPTFRASCAGTYQGGPIKHVVALDANGQLTLSPEGQPTYRLIPYQGRTFMIEAFEGFHVEFPRTDGGMVDAIIFHQPNGTSLARRIEEA